MTKPQIWVAVFLILFIALFLLGRMTKQKEPLQHPGNMPMGQTQLSGDELSAQELLIKWNCISCHGQNMQGTGMGPALVNLTEFWSRDRLINYLRNPSSFMDNDRFREYKKKYPGIIMPPFNNVDVKDLGKMADYLLELK